MGTNKVTNDVVAAGQARAERDAKKLRDFLIILSEGSVVLSVDVKRISMRIGGAARVDTLVTFIVEDSEGARWVGFNVADDPFRALLGGLSKIHNNEMKWKVDEYN